MGVARLPRLLQALLEPIGQVLVATDGLQDAENKIKIISRIYLLAVAKLNVFFL